MFGGIDVEIIAALLLDTIYGDPRCVPHPVAGIGRLIVFYEKILYAREGAKARGALLCAAVLVTVGAAVWLLLSLAASINTWVYATVNIYLLYVAIAFKSLKKESAPVAFLLASGDLDGARRQVGRIVGRDTELLSESGVVRATVETIAESYVDGIVSVLFYMALGSLCGQAALFAWLFKAASTMDSMIGYDDERYHDFGWAAAKLDDVLNFIPARIGGVVAIAAGALCGMDYRHAWRVFRRDRLNHKSPNSAHGESVFAGLLGIQLGGGAFYGGEWEPRPTLGDDMRDPKPNDILRAHNILNVSVALCALLIFVILEASTIRELYYTVLAIDYVMTVIYGFFEMLYRGG